MLEERHQQTGPTTHISAGNLQQAMDFSQELTDPSPRSGRPRKISSNAAARSDRRPTTPRVASHPVGKIGMLGQAT
jgi:hypothetical protein